MQATGAFQRYLAVAAGGRAEAVNARLSQNPPAPKTTAAQAGGAFRPRGRSVGIPAPPGGNHDTNGAVPRANGDTNGGDDCEGTGGDTPGAETGEGGEATAAATAAGDGQPAPAAVEQGDSYANEIRRGKGRGAQQERLPLAREQRAALKRALSALREPADGGEGGSSSAVRSADATAEGEHGERDLGHGGVRASELSGVVYGAQAPSDRGDGWGEGDELDGGGGEGSWKEGVECSVDELEEILVELDEEEGLEKSPVG